MEVEGGDVGGHRGHVGIHVAVVALDEGFLGDGGAGEAVEFSGGVLVAEIGCRDVDFQLGCTGTVDFGEETHDSAIDNGEDADLIAVECEPDAFHGAGDGDGDFAVGEGRSAEGGSGDGAVSALDLIPVDVEAWFVVGQRVFVHFHEHATLSDTLGVGLVGKAEIGSRREDSGEVGENRELGSLFLLLGGAGVLDEGIVGTIDVLTLPHRTHRRAELPDLDTHVSACIFTHSFFSLG